MVGTWRTAQKSPSQVSSDPKSLGYGGPLHNNVQGNEEREREREEKSAEHGPTSAGRSVIGGTSIS